MRLIDADALPSALFQKHVHDEEELEPMLYFEDAVKVVENAPTIGAIPVEWMERKRKEALREGMRPDEVEAVEMVLWMWQKEQETRNESKV